MLLLVGIRCFTETVCRSPEADGKGPTSILQLGKRPMIQFSRFQQSSHLKVQKCCHQIAQKFAEFFNIHQIICIVFLFSTLGKSRHLFSKDIIFGISMNFETPNSRPNLFVHWRNTICLIEDILFTHGKNAHCYIKGNGKLLQQFSSSSQGKNSAKKGRIFHISFRNADIKSGGPIPSS